MHGPFVAPEVAVRRAGREHEEVVGDRAGVQRHDLARGVDRRDLAHQHARIRLPAHQVAHRPGDLGRRQAGRRHLVQERLEEVVVLAIDQRDVDGLAPQALRDGKAGKSGPDDNDSRFMTVSHWHRTYS